MASFTVDQAEGLRRMLEGPKPRIFTFLSATSRADKHSMLVNLGASLVRAGSEALILDATLKGNGVCTALDMQYGPSLMEVAGQGRSADDAVCKTAQGIGAAMLTRGSVQIANGSAQTRRLTDAFGTLAKRSDIILIDGELDDEHGFPLEAMSGGDIVVQVGPGAASIKEGYAIIKRLNAHLGKRSFGVLVTGASEEEAQVIFKNMAQAASRYLAVPLHSLGCVPADDHLKRAARTGRAVIDAFPLAGASVAFRQLAGRFAVLMENPAIFRGRTSGGSDIRP